MCGSGAYRQTTSGGLYPSGKVAILLSRAWGVALDPASRRVNITGNLEIMGLGAVAATPAMVSLVCVNCARVGAGSKVGVPHAWVEAGGKAGVLRVWDGEKGNVGVSYLLVLVLTAWRACVCARLGGLLASSSSGAAVAFYPLGLAR